MTNQENKIPIKGYSNFHPLKHCMVGSGFKAEWFNDLSISKDNRVLDPLKQIAEETEEDYQSLVKILNDAGVKTYRSFMDIEKYESLKNIPTPPTVPRDHFAVIGEKLYVNLSGMPGYSSVLKNISRENIHFTSPGTNISTSNICRVGKDLWWDCMIGDGHLADDKATPNVNDPAVRDKYVKMWEDQGYRVHLTEMGYHVDGSFCVVKPGCIVSLHDIKDYKTEFPGWDVLYLPDQSWSKVDKFLDMKNKVGGKWWLKGEEHNDQLIQFVNTWLNDWVGYVEETVFDVNMLSLDENTIICNNYNKDVFDHFKKHKVEPVIFNFRHRYFWDGGVHCITQDLYREGEREDYFG